MDRFTSPLKLFITDDDADDRELIAEALLGVRKDAFVGEFSDGGQLIENLFSGKNGLPNLIILDMNMPIKNGLETLRELKASDILANIPVVMLTTSSKPSDEENSYSLGAAKYFRKPSRLEEYAALAGMIISFAINTAHL